MQLSLTNFLKKVNNTKMKKSLKTALGIIGLTTMMATGAFAQSIPTLELSSQTFPSDNGFGTSIRPSTVQFVKDQSNNGTFSANSPVINFTVSLQNQQFTGLNYGGVTAFGDTTAQTTGLVFGAGPSLATDPVVFGAYPYNRFNIMGEYGGGGGPVNIMFTSNPKATGTQLGTGFEVKDNVPNAGFEVFTTAQALFGTSYGIGSRVYFGDIVLTYSEPVINPVVHIAGLGGSYRYLPIGITPDIPANYKNAFFSTELELANTGITSTKLSGNAFFQISGNNVLNSNNANPNGGSVEVLTEQFNNYGAATGSVRINGTVTELRYRVYLESGTASDFPWSVVGSQIQGATRNPFTGDIWYVSSSLDKPTQQISGNVYNDKDGLTDNNINQSAGVKNTKTNAGGLNANLVNSSNQVVASVPVTPEGVYLFDNVPVGSYTVQLTTNPSAGTYASPASLPATALPATWVNTGDFIGAGAGNDGSANGRSTSITVAADQIKNEINFGIERLPESVNKMVMIPKPTVGDLLALNGAIYPELEGSDPEDMPTSGILTGKTVKITSLVTNATLLYNGIPAILGQVIPNYNASNLKILVGVLPLVPQFQFQYAYVDAAGFADPTPATYTINYTAGPLPITLGEFTATPNSCTAALNWKTLSEANSDKFEVEVSTTNGTSYEKIANVAAAGTSSDVRSYGYNYSMQTGVVYLFRLKFVDKDGNYTYSDTRKVSCNSRVQITLAPNPVHNSFELRGLSAGKNNVTVYSANGQMVASEVISQTQGSVNVSRLASGMYNVRVTDQTGLSTTIQIIKN